VLALAGPLHVRALAEVREVADGVGDDGIALDALPRADFGKARTGFRGEGVCRKSPRKFLNLLGEIWQTMAFRDAPCGVRRLLTKVGCCLPKTSWKC
jgi:hypothetical protein